MYEAKITNVTGEFLLGFRSESRPHMRVLESLCIENGYSCEVVVDVAPRVITFRNPTPTPAAEAKVDAKADIAQADKGK